MLTKRQLEILQIIIRLYTKQQEPIGSKTLLKEVNLPFSSATIRNEMMRLEELGFLEKTHSSSGRIPSMRGYRFYIDHLLPTTDFDDIEKNELQNIRKTLHNHYNEVSDIVEVSAKMLSNLTNYTTIVLAPETKQSRLISFRLVQLNQMQILAILITDKGFVENQLINLTQAMSTESIERLATFLNTQLVGLNLNEVYDKLQYDIPLMIQDYCTNDLQIVQIILMMIQKLEFERISIAGKTNLFNYMDSQTDRTKLKMVYDLIEDAQILQELLVSTDTQGMTIKIGSELNYEELDELSFITTTYSTKNGSGLIALIGPKNMSYDRVVGLMNVLSAELSDSLNQYFDYL